MRLYILRNFLSTNECQELNNIVIDGITNNWISTGITKGRTIAKNRLTSRFYGTRFITPSIVLDISNKVRDCINISQYSVIQGHGKDGIVVSCTSEGGDVYEHKDPTEPGLAALRCNIMTQKPESGGVLYIEDQEVPLECGDLHCYLASEHLHRVSIVHGSISRNLWMFGAYVPADDWNSGKIIPKQ